MGLPKTKRLPTHRERDASGKLIYRPTYAVWEVTLRCDQCCHFCGTRAGHARSDELDTAEAVDVIRQLSEMGCREVALHGGEAYLRADWLELVRAVRQHGMDCTMVTGGKTMTREQARQAAEAGMTAVSVSIDGLEPTHDALRGVRGSWASATAALTYLHEAGVKIGCNTQVNRRNFRELPSLVEALAAWPLYGWQVQLMVPMGRAADAESLWLQPYDMLELMPTLGRTRRRADELGIVLWPGDNVGYFGTFEHLLRHDRSRSGHSGGCGGGILAIGIEAHGDVKGCSAMGSEGFSGGNVRRASLQSIWDEAPELKFSREFRLDDLWGFCRTCYYAEVCKGGCPWTAATLTGRRGNNPYCHHRALELLAIGKRERLVQTERAEGKIRDTAQFELILEDAPEDWVAGLPDQNPSSMHGVTNPLQRG